MVINYKRDEAVSYARKWALSSNPNFYHFGGIGGDCTNFVSQCLLAGGAKMNFSYNGWFYINSYNRSPSWTAVNSFQNFLFRDKEIGPFGKIEKLESLEIGDLIFLQQNPIRFNHSLIISKIEGKEIYVCAHSDDSLDRPLSSYKFLKTQGFHIEGIRI